MTIIDQKGGREIYIERHRYIVSYILTTMAWPAKLTDRGLHFNWHFKIFLCKLSKSRILWFYYQGHSPFEEEKKKLHSVNLFVYATSFFLQWCDFYHQKKKKWIFFLLFYFYRGLKVGLKIRFAEILVFCVCVRCLGTSSGDNLSVCNIQTSEEH